MSDQQCGDVILRDLGGQFVLIDAQTERPIVGPVQLSDAILVAKAHGAKAIWQQSTDDRGRPMGLPMRISLS